MNKIRVNMNMKTTHSTGVKSVDELLEVISDGKIEYFSITDYENVDSAKTLKKLEINGFVRGVEFRPFLENNENNYRVSILGYNYDIDKMEKELIKIKTNRDNELKKIIDKFNKDTGSTISLDSNLDSIINEFVQLKIFEDYNETINYINDTFDKELLMTNLKDTIKMIKEADGVAVWAHPYQVLDYNNKLIRIGHEEVHEVFEEIIEAKIDGIEVTKINYGYNQALSLTRMVNNNNLFYTLGTNYTGKQINAISFSSVVGKDSEFETVPMDPDTHYEEKLEDNFITKVINIKK